MASYFISNAIPYVNSNPHLGHVYEFIQTDVFARYARSQGKDVFYLSGSDENALKNAQAAILENISVQELVERNALKFSKLSEVFSLSNDDFIRTSSDPRHLLGAAKAWEKLAERGDLYKKSYTGLYCLGCEQFYNADELVGGVCHEHLTTPEEISEENYFFRLSNYQDQLLKLIESNQIEIIPTSRRNEILSFLQSPLRDISVSRSTSRARNWGIQIPSDPEQVMYVWIDALTNYINALNYAEEGEAFDKYWRQSIDRVHVIGKGIIRFHALYWPALLLALDLPLPTKLFVHGYITQNSQKISKSLNNASDIDELVARYGPESIRYFLLSEISPYQDGDFSEDKLIARHNSDLANGLGNLLSRTLSMVEKYADSVTPKRSALSVEDLLFLSEVSSLPTLIDKAMKEFDYRASLAHIWHVISLTDQYINSNAPWSLYKNSQTERLHTVLNLSVTSLGVITNALAPFLPSTHEKMLTYLPNLSHRDPADYPIVNIGPLFPRLEKEIAL